MTGEKVSMSTNIIRDEQNHKMPINQKINLTVKTNGILKTKNMKNILVTIDFEKEANLLIETASEFAKKFDSKLWLLHVAAPDPDFVGYAAGPQNEIDFRTDELKGEFRIIEQYARQLSNTGIDVEALLVKGQTIGTILEKVESLNIDIVIIGHHKHSFFYKTFVGNTDAALINKSKVPVLLVPLENDYHPELAVADNANLPYAIW